MLDVKIGGLRAAYEDRMLRECLASLKVHERERIVARAAAKALMPVRNELRRAWRAAKRRRGTVTRKIAQYQEVRYRVGQRGSAKGGTYAEVGTNYARGGQAKLWHILERGFVHYGRHATYRPDPIAVRRAAAWVANARQRSGVLYGIDSRKAHVAAEHKAGRISTAQRDRQMADLNRELDQCVAFKVGDAAVLNLAAKRRAGRTVVRDEARHFWDPDRHGDPYARATIGRIAHTLLARTGLVADPKIAANRRAGRERVALGMRRIPGMMVSTPIAERAMGTVQIAMTSELTRGIAAHMERAARKGGKR